MQGLPGLSRLVVIDGKMDAPEVFAIAGGQAAVFSSPSPARPDRNEDAAAVIPYGDDAAVLVIADGVGGEPGGRRASKTAINTIAATLSDAHRRDLRLRNAILNGIEAANAAVRDLGIGAASTIAIAGIDGGRMRPFHAGDSLIMVTGQRGRIKLETVAHSPVGFAMEAGLIDEAEAIRHEDRHIISNALGDNDLRIEMGPVLDVAQRDTVLIASDGLVDNLRTNEITEAIRKGGLKDAATRAATLAAERMTASEHGKPDDLTLILFRLK